MVYDLKQSTLGSSNPNYFKMFSHTVFRYIISWLLNLAISEQNIFSIVLWRVLRYRL